jgi:PHD/YefM family antitoxin component YafN of YafNO toxin-antitoxin module
MRIRAGRRQGFVYHGGTTIMTTDTDGNEEMVKLNVKVPKGLLEEINQLAAELDYPNRSEFIREVLRDTTQPILTPGAQEGLSEGYTDVEASRTMSTDEARRRLGIDETED